MTCALIMLIGPAEAVAVSASRAVPETIEVETPAWLIRSSLVENR